MPIQETGVIVANTERTEQTVKKDRKETRLLCTLISKIKGTNRMQDGAKYKEDDR